MNGTPCRLCRKLSKQRGGHAGNPCTTQWRHTVGEKPRSRWKKQRGVQEGSISCGLVLVLVVAVVLGSRGGGRGGGTAGHSGRCSPPSRDESSRALLARGVVRLLKHTPSCPSRRWDWVYLLCFNPLKFSTFESTAQRSAPRRAQSASNLAGVPCSGRIGRVNVRGIIMMDELGSDFSTLSSFNFCA